MGSILCCGACDAHATGPDCTRHAPVCAGFTAHRPPQSPAKPLLAYLIIPPQGWRAIGVKEGMHLLLLAPAPQKAGACGNDGPHTQAMLACATLISMRCMPPTGCAAAWDTLPHSQDFLLYGRFIQGKCFGDLVGTEEKSSDVEMKAREGPLIRPWQHRPPWRR